MWRIWLLTCDSDHGLAAPWFGLVFLREESPSEKGGGLSLIVGVSLDEFRS